MNLELLEAKVYSEDIYEEYDIDDEYEEDEEEKDIPLECLGLWDRGNEDERWIMDTMFDI